MTVPATVSVTAAVAGAMIAALALGFSAAPGWRELRYFAASACLAALYAACNVVVTLDVQTGVITWASRLSLAFGGLHALSWFAYLAAQENRSLSSLERVVVIIGTCFGLLALVPGVLISDQVSAHEFAPFGVVYRDAQPTELGVLCFAFFSFGLLLLCLRYGARWRAGVPGAGLHFGGLAILFGTGLNDALAASSLVSAPYLLDLGFLAVVCAVGAAVTGRFVLSAVALRESSLRLEAAQAERVKQERLDAQGELSAVVAHEVRNPLGVVFNSLASLRRILPRHPDSEALLAMVSEEAERLDRMVGDLLELSRPSPPRLAPVSPERLLKEAAEAAQETMADRQAVRIELPGPLPLMLLDEAMLRQALAHLIANAIQSPGRTQPVCVRAQQVPDGLRIEVVDNGAGVPSELADRIFSPFFTTRASGTGLGLAMVRRVAEAHQGAVSVGPTPGGGATFVLLLPNSPEVPSRTELDPQGQTGVENSS